MTTGEKEKKGLNISAKSFVSAIAVISISSGYFSALPAYAVPRLPIPITAKVSFFITVAPNYKIIYFIYTICVRASQYQGVGYGKRQSIEN
jgi:hypothetical protein